VASVLASLAVQVQRANTFLALTHAPLGDFQVLEDVLALLRRRLREESEQAQLFDCR
jgi:hypothetical protein